jgi:hypothetical protein
MKIAMALVIASPAVFYILETMWTVAFRVLGLILAVIMFRRTGAPESASSRSPRGKAFRTAA